MLTFTKGSLQKYYKHIQQVIKHLQEARLNLELSKCEFDVQRTKYLEFILEARRGTLIDPKKV